MMILRRSVGTAVFCLASGIPVDAFGLFAIPLAVRATSPGKEGALGGQQDRRAFPGRKDSKGLHAEFFPNRSVFHVSPMDAASKTDPAEIQVSELKAVFFVRDFMRNKGYDKRKVLNPREKVQGRLIEVTFRDGEVLVVSTTGYDPKRLGFFFFPIDPKSNNTRACIVSCAIRGGRVSLILFRCLGNNNDWLLQ